jgi:hypothetical protein
MLLDGHEGLGAEAKLNETVVGLPPQLLVLQVDELLLLGLVVGEGHVIGAVRLLVREGTDPACMHIQNIRHSDDLLVLAIEKISKESHVRATMGWSCCCCCLGRTGPAAERETPTRLRPASCEVAKPREEAELALRAAGVEKEELSSVVVVAMALRLG